ncbi:dienelactone hydrolase family protein [Phenylobacterium immobile]|uniref:dienelactone hydrolase family protein n=1 Tax=Phenylobacterium immobile TaxID=21 RepID=UPI000A86B89F|nr:dienelactone hydrolase family protein [Phenylobacterium immobile]
MCEKDDLGLISYNDVTRRGFTAMAAGGIAAAAGAGAAVAAAAVEERNVMVKTPDGECDAALFLPQGLGAKPGVVFWPDIFGLRPAMRDMGRRLAGEGYVVLVVNPFYRGGDAESIAAKAAPLTDRMEKMKVFGAERAKHTDDAIASDAKTFVAYLDALAETSDAKVGVQGYCMGGPLSFRTAAAVPARIGAVGSFHGAGLTTDQPNSPHLLVASTDATYLVCIAKNDDGKDPQSKVILTETFAKTGKSGTVEVYGGDHGWCVPDSAVYNQGEAERAWGNLLKTYKTALV